MRLWIDEDLSPSLTGTCHEAGYQATCVRDRGRLTAKDSQLAPIVYGEEWVFVTNNAGDFLKIAEAQGIHPGLVFMDLGSAEQEREWMQNALDYIAERSVAEGQAPEVFMTNRVVEVDTDGRCSDFAWP